ncbi:slipin family protein, partial [Candidatus Bathyarchaeota archaeon]|nr:slipin family protein [Candidatus Bathyarchaeota archaeon]
RMWFWIGIILVLVAAFIIPAFYVVPQWERAAVIRFGKIEQITETGLHLRVPIVDSIQRVDIRTQTIDLMGQSAITKDNISVVIDAVVFMKIEDPERLILQIQDYRMSVNKYAQTAIRNIIGTYDLDVLLEKREDVALKLKEEIDLLVKDWGIDITRAGLQDISLPEDMKRAFAVQAEAERESRAVIIKASAELQASVKLKEAAANMKDPNAMQLRILSTIDDISKDQSNTIVLALPLETLRSSGVAGAAAMAGLSDKITN